MNLKELIKKAHDNAVKKGFYDCGVCGGTGEYFQKNPDCKNCGVCFERFEKSIDVCDVPSKCNSCNGTGKESRNTGELLMLIVSEIGEALEAHRKGRFADFTDYSISELSLESFNYFDTPEEIKAFENCIKDTFQDELADVFIRLFDFCGYMKIEPVDFPHGVTLSENVGEGLLEITHMICEFLYDNYYSWRNESMYEIFHYLQFFCEMHKIDIEKHIELKMRYNETREYKHGKRY